MSQENGAPDDGDPLRSPVESAPLVKPGPKPNSKSNPETFHWPRLVASPRPPGRYDRAELALFLIVLVLSAFTPSFTKDGRPNAPFMQSLEDGTGGGVCLLKRAADLDCAGCGMTRAFVQLGHGGLWRAVLLNPLSPAVFLWVLVRVLDLLVFNLRGRRLDLGIPKRWTWHLWTAFFVAFLALFAWRVVTGLTGT